LAFLAFHLGWVFAIWMHRQLWRCLRNLWYCCLHYEKMYISTSFKNMLEFPITHICRSSQWFPRINIIYIQQVKKRFYTICHKRIL
jgi:hypothetical protein